MYIRISIRFCFFLLLILRARDIRALDPSQPVDSYIRTHFTNEEGLPGNVVDQIVQSRDGFLWLVVNGYQLTRFDGRRFTGFDQPRNVLALALAPDGDLWVGTRDDLERIPAAALNQFGRLPAISYQPGPGNSSRINCLHFSRSGVLWVGTEAGLYTFDSGTFSCIIPRLAIGRIEEASNGHLLVITSQGFMEWDGSRAVQDLDLPAQLRVRADKIYHVLEDRRGATWFCTGKGVAHRINGSIEKLPAYGPGNEAFRAYEDPRGTVWIAKSAGLFRATASGLEVVKGMNVRHIYGDRDGNLWIGTNGDGLFRFRDRAVRMFTTADGLPNNVVMTVLASQDGGLWIGANCGGLSRLDGRRFQTYNEKNGLLNTCVWALAEDAKHDLWIGTYGGGVFRFRGRRFTQYSKAQGFGSDRVTGIVPAHDGSLWFATRDGVTRMRDGHVRNYTTVDGLSDNIAFKVYEDRTGGIWVGTRQGIDRMVGDRFVNLSSIPKTLVLPIGEDRSGGLYFRVGDPDGGIFRVENNQPIDVAPNIEPTDMVETEQGDLWLNGTGILRVPTGGLQRAHRQDEPVDYAAFGRADGLTSTEASVGEPNSALTRDGKLWIATPQGLAMLDLPQFPMTDQKPAIYIEEVTVGRTPQAPGHELVLPPGTHHVELHFDAVELSSPERIRLQYRLDSVDSEWLDAGTPSRAIYTNIPSGTHVLHLRACNRDGIWDRTGVAYNITQQPYFYQTRLFLLATVTAGLLLLGGVYRLRLRQATARLNTRLEERLAERTRLARDFHDTLIQTIQGSKMVADDALDESSDPVRMRSAMEQLSVWLGQAMQEGRAALNSLRTSTTQGNDLAEAFQRAAETCRIPGTMAITFSVIGDARNMHPIVRDEVYRIGYEAIRNACVHSRASQLEVELTYAQDLAVRVNDNGIGIDPAVADKGKDGHFGLQGMRERVERIGAKLTLVSSATSGTEITVVVPGGIVFRKASANQYERIKAIFRR